VQRDQYFGRVAHASQEICRHAHQGELAPTGTLFAGLLCRLFEKTRAVDREIRLEARAVWSETVAAETEILCREGTLWVTRGDARDYVLKAGEMLRVERGARVVVSGLGQGGTMTIVPGL